MDCATLSTLHYGNTMALDNPCQLSVLRGARERSNVAPSARAAASGSGWPWSRSRRRPSPVVKYNAGADYERRGLGAAGAGADALHATLCAGALHATLCASALLQGSNPIRVALVKGGGENDSTPRPGRGTLRVVEQEQMLEPPCWFGGFGS